MIRQLARTRMAEIMTYQVQKFVNAMQVNGYW